MDPLEEETTCGEMISFLVSLLSIVAMGLLKIYCLDHSLEMEIKRKKKLMKLERTMTMNSILLSLGRSDVVQHFLTNFYVDHGGWYWIREGKIRV